MNKTTLCTLFLMACLTLFASNDKAFMSAGIPGGNALVIIKEGEIYLEFGYYDWGPGWSGVSRKSDSEDKGDHIAFTINSKLQQTKASYTIDGTWKQTAPDTLEFVAQLKPQADSELMMAQVALSPSKLFDGQTLLIKHADGTQSEETLPLGKGSLGEAVTQLIFKDAAGEVASMDFANPTSISTDRQLRLIIAKDKIQANKTEQLAFRLKLPKATQFITGAQSARAISGMDTWYPFDAASPIPQNSEWNMTNWLDAPAGKHGRITRKGDKLFYNGKTIKLWGINVCYNACAPDKSLADKRADFYAAMGINSIRLHKYADGTGWAGITSKDSAVKYDPAELDKMDYFVAKLKERGIFTKLSPVFIMDIGPGDRERIPYMDELGRMGNNRINPKHGSFYLSQELQDMLMEQVVKLLKHKNPYTGNTYANEPAIAYFELYNEDSALFGGVTTVMAQSPTLRARGGKMFAQWLKNKYGSEQAFLEAWGEKALNGSMLPNQKLPQDESWQEERIYPAGNPWFFDPSNLETSQKPYKQRLLDTMQFLYELQNNIYARYIKAIRDAGYQGELITSNWQAGRMMSHFYNLHSDTLASTIDRHNYFGGGARTGVFNAGSMLARQGSEILSSSIQAVDDMPFMLSEWIHVYPNEWSVEGAAIIAAYGMGLQGWDVSYAFQNFDNGTFNKAIGTEMWEAMAPNFMGIFPAVSRQVLRQDVAESTVVHHRNVHIPSLATGDVGFNEFVQQNWDMKTFTSDVFPAEAIAAAKGVVRFTDTKQPTEAFDLDAYRHNDGIRSSTEQLFWKDANSTQDGFITINTPGTQALVGFSNNQTQELDDVAIITKNKFAAIYVTAQHPQGTLKTDRKLLVTAIARARNSDQIVLADSVMIAPGERNGHRFQGPVIMEPVHFYLKLNRGGSPTVHVLDHAGVKTGKTLHVNNGVVEIDTAKHASPYYLIEY